MIAYSMLSIGQDIPERIHNPTNVELFRFSAATGNPHRIHYDQAYARREGYEDVLVQGPLHGSLIIQYLLDWAGAEAKIRMISWENRRYALVREALKFCGRVIKKWEENHSYCIHCKVTEGTLEGTICVQASAVLVIPRDPK